MKEDSVGEIGEMRWGALKFDGIGMIVNITFKTGKPRYIRLFMAKEHLIKWKSDYPEEITDNAFVFPMKISIMFLDSNHLFA